MTEHTPLDDLVSRMHIHFGTANAMGDDFAADDFANVIRILENMPAKLAAAEQRGAAKAWDEGAKAIKSCLTTAVDGSIVWDWEAAEPHNPYRADQEGDA